MDAMCACGCGLPIPPREPGRPGRPAKYVREHAPDKRAGKRQDRRQVTPSIAPVRALPAAEPEPEADLVTVTREELAAAGRERSPEGLIVLTLAAQIAAGGGTQAGLAALIREFHASKSRALEGASGEADVIEGIFGT